MTDEVKPLGEEAVPETAADASTADANLAGTAVAEPGETATAVEEEKKDKLDQQVEISDAGPCKKHIKVTVRRDDIDKRLNEKYSELVGDSHVPGFRPGKAPREIVVRKFKKDVMDQVRGQVLLASLEQLAEDFDVAPLSPPNLNPDKLEIPDKGDFIYEFEVEVRPQFDLPDYKGLKLTRPVKTFSEKEVQEEEHKILSRYGSLIPKEGKAELGDYVIVDMTTKFLDQPIGSATEITIRIEDTVAFKDGVADKFGEQMIGVTAGEARVVEIVMSDAVANPGLKGQTVKAHFDVKDIKKMRLPELTAAFLENFGVHSPEQLREQVRLSLERRLEYTQRQSAREQVLSHIAASSTWELPQDLLLRQARKALARRVMEMQEAGMTEQEIEARQRLLQRDVIANTALALKEHFVLQKLAEVEKIEVEDDEIDLEIERLADLEKESPRRVRAQLEKDDLLETLAAQLIERKALNLILEHAAYEDVGLDKKADAGLETVETQAVPGEMKDPTEAPPEEPAEPTQPPPE
ncbi:MAG: trigger factor [Planctomycetes bacterium]|nr:trigger factor [Planctomycetota bacterium]